MSFEHCVEISSRCFLNSHICDNMFMILLFTATSEASSRSVSRDPETHTAREGRSHFALVGLLCSFRSCVRVENPPTLPL